MSVQEHNLSPSCDSPFSLETIPQVSLFLSDRNNTSSTEVSTPLLKKPARAKPSRLWVEPKRSPLTQNLATFEQNSANERFLDAHLSSLNQTPLAPLELCSPYGSSSCGDESPLEIKLQRISPISVSENRFTQEFYQRIEEFMDAEDLHISHPDEYTNKRAFISKLKVLTQRSFRGISSNQSEGDDNSQSGTTFSEFDSPSTISPSIQTSSLFIRRSMSKDSPIDTTYKKSKFSLHKSPFFHHGQIKRETDENNLNDSNKKNSEKQTPTFTPIKILNEEDTLDKVSPAKNIIISDLNMKLRVLALEENQEFSEPSSATSLRILELSPRKI